MKISKLKSETIYDELNPIIKSIGSTFKQDNHYYLQCSDMVLHINMSETSVVINNLHSGFLKLESNVEPISIDEFNEIMNDAIRLLGIDSYFNS